MQEYGSQNYADIWNLGMNFALKISDLLAITYEDVIGKETLMVVEGKTKKTRQIKLNDTATGIIARRYADNPTDTYLFQATGKRVSKVAEKPLDQSTVARNFAEIGDM